MGPDYIEIGGKSYRVEMNWNAFTAFLKSIGKDSFESFAEVASPCPSDVHYRMAAALNEGARLDGLDVRFTAEELGAVCSFATITRFLQIYANQINPQNSEDGSKKE